VLTVRGLEADGEFARIVQEMRLRAGLTIPELAEQMGVSKGAVHQYLYRMRGDRGTSTMKSFLRLAEVCRCEVTVRFPAVQERRPSLRTIASRVSEPSTPTASSSPAPAVVPTSGPSRFARDGTRLISRTQADTFHARCTALGRNEAVYRAYLKDCFGSARTDDIPWVAFDEVLQWLETDARYEARVGRDGANGDHG
jgi:transcriptional regulator with XRE-family HTH domain